MAPTQDGAAAAFIRGRIKLEPYIQALAREAVQASIAEATGIETSVGAPSAAFAGQTLWGAVGALSAEIGQRPAGRPPGLWAALTHFDANLAEAESSVGPRPAESAGTLWENAVGHRAAAASLGTDVGARPATIAQTLWERLTLLINTLASIGLSVGIRPQGAAPAWSSVTALMDATAQLTTQFEGLTEPFTTVLERRRTHTNIDVNTNMVGPTQAATIDLYRLTPTYLRERAAREPIWRDILLRQAEELETTAHLTTRTAVLAQMSAGFGANYNTGLTPLAQNSTNLQELAQRRASLVALAAHAPALLALGARKDDLLFLAHRRGRYEQVLAQTENLNALPDVLAFFNTTRNTVPEDVVQRLLGQSTSTSLPTIAGVGAWTRWFRRPSAEKFREGADQFPTLHGLVETLENRLAEILPEPARLFARTRAGEPTFPLQFQAGPRLYPGIRGAQALRSDVTTLLNALPVS